MPQDHIAMTGQASLALMKFLANLARRLGVGKSVYVVGGAVRNFVMDPTGKRYPVKDIDVVIDSIALGGKDSMWFAKQIAKAIPARTNTATNQYGVALLHIIGDWMIGGENLKGEDIEIANARTESYTDGGYTPDTVDKATIEQDVYRREFTFNSLLWRLHDLAEGPDKAEILDLTGCGLKDIKDGVMRCPSSPDKTFSDDPSRMIRAIKFLVKYGFKIAPDVKRSILKNKGKIKNIPPAHLSNMLINTFLREPTGKKALIEMQKLGILDEIKDIAKRNKSFRDALGNWVDREAKVEFIFDLMDMGFPSGKLLTFLDRGQIARVREITVSLSSDAARQYIAVLRQPGKSVDTRALMQDFNLKGSAVRQIALIARRHLLSDPALAMDSRRLTQRVREDLKGGKVAAPLPQQSPIDLPQPPSSKKPPFQVDYQARPLVLDNDGHNIEGFEQDQWLIQGGVRYRVTQYHFHSPSEHHLGGVGFPMELHIVHESDEGQLLVLGVFVDIGQENTTLHSVFSHLPIEGRCVHLPKMDLNRLLPQGNVFEYLGSLTTPPYTEGVRWFVYDTPLQASLRQIQSFQRFYRGNNRGIQPLNGRAVQRLGLKKFARGGRDPVITVGSREGAQRGKMAVAPVRLDHTGLYKYLLEFHVGRRTPRWEPLSFGGLGLEVINPDPSKGFRQSLMVRFSGSPDEYRWSVRAQKWHKSRRAPTRVVEKRVRDLTREEREFYQKSPSEMLQVLRGVSPSMLSVLGLRKDLLPAEVLQFLGVKGIKLAVVSQGRCASVKGTGVKTGLMIPLPKGLAAQFPSIGDEDDSPTHCTFLYVGDVRGREDEFIRVVKAEVAASVIGPVRATLQPLDYFVHPEQGRRVAYCPVRFSGDMAQLRDRIRTRLVEAGFTIQDRSPLVYSPHVTLGYLEGLKGTWDGPVPTGSWMVEGLAIWGLSRVDVAPLSRRAKKFELNIGDPLFTGKYLNSPGRIESFGGNGKGDPTVIVRKKPKGERGQGAKKEVKVFKVRFDKDQAKRDKAEKKALERVAMRWVSSQIRMAFEHDTDEGLKRYLHDHPNAKAKNHTVKKPDSALKAVPKKKIQEKVEAVVKGVGSKILNAAKSEGGRWKDVASGLRKLFSGDPLEPRERRQIINYSIQQAMMVGLNGAILGLVPPPPGYVLKQAISIVAFRIIDAKLGRRFQGAVKTASAKQEFGSIIEQALVDAVDEVLGKYRDTTATDRVAQRFLLAAMHPVVRVAGTNLQSLAKHFIKEVHPNLDTRSCDATKGRCDGVSSRLHYWLEDRGIQSNLLEARGLIPPLGSRANSEWRAFVGGNTTNQQYLSHVVVQVGDEILDMTAAQFGLSSGIVVEPVGAFRKRWQKVKGFKPWARTGRSKKASTQTLYHGTNQVFRRFDLAKVGKRDAGNLGRGFYLSKDPTFAMRYAEDNVKRWGGDPVVLKVRANLRHIADFYKMMPRMKKELGVGFPPRPTDTDRVEALRVWFLEQGYDAAQAGSEIVVYNPMTLTILGQEHVPTERERMKAILQRFRQTGEATSEEDILQHMKSAAGVVFAATARPGSRGQVSIRQGVFTLWYLPKYQEHVAGVLAGLQKVSALYQKAGYKLPGPVPVLMAARGWGSQRSIYTGESGGFIQLVPASFIGRANFATLVHEVAHYLHAHGVRGGFANPIINRKFVAVLRSSPDEGGGTSIDQAVSDLKGLDKEYTQIARSIRPGMAFGVRLHQGVGPGSAYVVRQVRIQKKKRRGDQIRVVMEYLEPTQKELSYNILGHTLPLSVFIRRINNPGLQSAMDDLDKRRQVALDRYNAAVSAQDENPLLQYEAQQSTWFPTAYSKENAREWFAELVSARLLASSRMDPTVSAWLSAVIKGTVKSAAKFQRKREVPKAKGKGTTTVYEYSDGQIQHRNREKAEKVEKLRGNLGKLRAAVKKDLKSTDPKTRLCALAVGLMNDTYERVGNDSSAKDGHVGVTGWAPEHLSFSGNKATFTYIGKSGVSQKKTTSDAGLVAGLKEAIKDKTKGDTLFSYDGGRVDAGAVNTYLEPHGITAKDIRGLHANREVQTRLKVIRGKGGKLPSDDKERKTKLKKEFEQAVAEAAKEVGHEAATLRSQYLVPGIEENFLRDGTVKENLAKQGAAQKQASQADMRRFAILHINNATDGEEGGDLRGDAGLTSSLTLYEQAVVQDMDIHDVPLVKGKSGYKLRGHLIEPDVVTELTASGYLEEQGGKVVLSDMFKVKQRLYRAAGFMARDAVFRGSLRKFIGMADEAVVVFDWGQADVSDKGHDPADDMGGSALGYVFRLNNQWFSQLVGQMRPKRVRSERAGITGLRQSWKMSPSNIHLGTKTDGEKEQEEVERLQRRNPKKKPPRHDLRRNRMKPDDDDLEGLGQDGDRDLSRNYKKVAARVARRWVHRVGMDDPAHAPGRHWQTDAGHWVGKNRRTREVRPFGVGGGAEGKAKAFAQGIGGTDSDDEDTAGKDQEREKRQQKRRERQEGKQKRQERKQERDLFESETKSMLKDMVDKDTISDEVASAVLDMVGGSQLFKTYRADLVVMQGQLVDEGISTEMMRDLARDSFKGVDLGDPDAVASALVKMKVQEKLLLDPSNVGGKPLSLEPLDSADRVERAEASMKQFRWVSKDQRISAAQRAAEKVSTLKGSPEASELNSIIDGMHAAAVLNDEPFDVRGSDGKLLREPLSPKMRILLKQMAHQGDVGVLFLDDSTQVYQAQGREAVREAMSYLEDTAFISLSEGTPWASLGKALGGTGEASIEPDVAEYLRAMMRDMTVDSMTTVQGCAAALTRTKVDADSGEYDKTRERMDKDIDPDVEDAVDSFLADCIVEGGDLADCVAESNDRIRRVQIEGAMGVMDDADVGPDPQDVTVAVARNVAHGGDLSLLDDLTLQKEKPIDVQKRHLLEGVTDPIERERILQMTPDQFRAMSRTR